jgi:hypothetical protein
MRMGESLNGYEPEAWSDFGVGVVGAAAALAGLLFVAMSINISRILANKTLPSRAAGNLILFVLPLLAGTWILIPGQPPVALGVELIVTGLLTSGLLLRLQRPSNRSGESLPSWLFGGLAPSVLAGALTLVGGVSVIAEHGGGLYWVAPAIVLAFATGLAGAWVLLVEILR